MKRQVEIKHLTRAGLICAVLLTALPALSDNALTEEERQQGWQLLFDGENMSQWRNFKQQGLDDRWMVRDGAMTLTAKGGGDILTRKEYGNFDLRLEWKISEGGNSGIFFHADETGKRIYSHAPEVQILDDERHSDRKIDSHRSGSLYDMVASHPSSRKPAGEWNQVRVLHQGGFLQVWQNGVATVTIDMDSSTWETLLKASKFRKWKGFGESREGHIGLQDHGDEVAFRNLKILELD